jgi:hypothetical protein
VRQHRFGIVALVTALLSVTAWLGFIFWRLEPGQRPRAASTRRHYADLPSAAQKPADLASVRADLCRVARAELSFRRSVGHYASAPELRSNGDPSLPQNGRWPYHYMVYVPAPERFVIVASSHGPLEKRAPAILVDDTLHVCALRPTIPDFGWRLDHPPETWGSRPRDYDCESCP